jgi:hypothetical protein
MNAIVSFLEFVKWHVPHDRVESTPVLEGDGIEYCSREGSQGEIVDIGQAISKGRIARSRPRLRCELMAFLDKQSRSPVDSKCPLKINASVSFVCVSEGPAHHADTGEYRFVQVLRTTRFLGYEFVMRRASGAIFNEDLESRGPIEGGRLLGTFGRAACMLRCWRFGRAVLEEAVDGGDKRVGCDKANLC